MWVNDSPQIRFLCQLHNQVVDQMLSDPDQFLLRHMRHDYTMVREYQKRFGYIFKERGLNLFELIARACGEVWDNEDEEKGGVLAAEKSAPMEVKKRDPHAVSVDCPREVGVREGERQRNVVQAGDGRREVELQARRQVRRAEGRGGCSPQKAPPEKKKASLKVSNAHTKGLGNVEEGRAAEAAKPKKKRQRKRPVLGKAYKPLN